MCRVSCDYRGGAGTARMSEARSRIGSTLGGRTSSCLGFCALVEKLGLWHQMTLVENSSLGLSFHLQNVHG